MSDKKGSVQITASARKMGKKAAGILDGMDLQDFAELAVRRTAFEVITTFQAKGDMTKFKPVNENGEHIQSIKPA